MSTEGEELDQLLTNMVGSTLDEVLSRKHADWDEVLGQAHDSLTAQVIRIVSALDGDPLRSLTAELLHNAAARHLEDLLSAAFPHLLLPPSDN